MNCRQLTTASLCEAINALIHNLMLFCTTVPARFMHLFMFKLLIHRFNTGAIAPLGPLVKQKGTADEERCYLASETEYVVYDAEQIEVRYIVAFK